jgi:hypothetical protein
MIVRVFFYSVPLDYGWVDLVNNFKKHLTVSTFFIKILNKHAINI